MNYKIKSLIYLFAFILSAFLYSQWEDSEADREAQLQLQTAARDLQEVPRGHAGL